MLGLWKKYFSKDREYFNLIWNIIKVVPSNIDLYKLALIHKSSSVEVDGHMMNNERLEFLGDAVLQAISSEMVFLSNQFMSEGEMTRIRSRIVSRSNLNALSKHMGLDKAIIVRPRSLLTTDGDILGDAFEALVGAMYLDQGYSKTSDIVINLLQKKQNILKVVKTENDFKSRIIEWAQRNHFECKFVTTKSKEYTETSPWFKTVLLINSQELGMGYARNKKTSEQKAASKLYNELVKKGDLVVDE